MWFLRKRKITSCSSVYTFGARIGNSICEWTMQWCYLAYGLHIGILYLVGQIFVGHVHCEGSDI